eukprot:3119888-Rhodomonas_salina.2
MPTCIGLHDDGCVCVCVEEEEEGVQWEVDFEEFRSTACNASLQPSSNHGDDAAKLLCCVCVACVFVLHVHFFCLHILYLPVGAALELAGWTMNLTWSVIWQFTRLIPDRSVMFTKARVHDDGDPTQPRDGPLLLLP